MSIRFKTFAIFVITAILMIVALHAASYRFLLKNIEKQEFIEVEQKVVRVSRLIEKDVAALDTICGDWAHWDDTYEYLKTRNQQYVLKNISFDTFHNLKVNIVMVVDNNGRTVFEKALDFSSKTNGLLPEELKEQVYPGSPLLDHQDLKSSYSGILLTGEGMMVISAHPVSDTKRKAPALGTLIMARTVGSMETRDLEELASSKIIIQKLQEAGQKEEYVDILEELKVQVVAVRPDNPYFVSGYMVLKDLYGKQAYLLKTHMPRLIYRQGYISLHFFLLAFLLFVCVVFAVGAFLTQKTVISRLERISRFIHVTRTSKDISARFEIKGTDEIAGLGKEINGMLDEIGMVQKELERSEERLKLVLEGTGDGFWDWDMVNDKIYVSPRCLTMLGYIEAEFEDEIGRIAQLIHPEDFSGAAQTFVANILQETNYCRIEHRMLTHGGEWKWVLNRGKVVERDQEGKPLRMSGTLSDISEQKKAEQEILYLSYYDKLTGLYNRAYFERQLEKLDQSGKLPYSIILGDLNGLKITNDAFGHTKGDDVLNRIAGILLNSCKGTDTVARWGGDEFAVLLPGLNEGAAEEICNTIRKNCNEAEGFDIMLSIALGAVTKVDSNQSIGNLLKEAEEKMYRNKLLESRSIRNANISSLEQALAEKSYETEEHARRIRQTCMKVGKEIGLSNDELDELALLATLHDIGKVAIPDSILMKPEALNEEEWKIMKKHCEIGYRIAISSPELSHIADAILSHHESYDGSGYPQGLKGEEIPLISRIVTIADAFDVMTNNRPYKKIISKDEALLEIQRKSGMQFDPSLVQAFCQVITRE